MIQTAPPVQWPGACPLIDASGSRLHRIYISSEIFTIGSQTLVGACGLQVIVAATPAVVIDELNGCCSCWEEVPRGPCRRGSEGGWRNDSVGLECIWAETRVERNQRSIRIMDGAVRLPTTACGPERGHTCIDDAVGEDEVPDRGVFPNFIADKEQPERREGGDVIDRHVLKWSGSRSHGDLGKFTAAVILHTIDIVDDYIVNAVA